MKTNRSMSLELRSISNKGMQTEPLSATVLRAQSRSRQDKQNRSRSQSLQRQQKYPPPLTPIRINSTSHEKQVHSSKKVDVIQQKSEIEQDQNLQQMIEEIQSSYQPMERKSENVDSHDSSRQIHFELNNLSPSINIERKQGVMQQEQSPDPQDISKELQVIQACVVFWKRQQFNQLDLKAFQQLIKKYILIHVRPAALNRFGEKLLRNGYFVIAFIKYMTSRNVEPQIKTMMFQMFKNQFEIDRNYEEFQQAYSNNLKIISNRSSIGSNTSNKQFNLFDRQFNTIEDSSRRSIRTNISLKRKLSDSNQHKDGSCKSRQKYLRKQYKNIENLIVGSVVSSALGNLRQFVLTETTNNKHTSPQYILIPRKKQQTVNLSSLTSALKQSQQITKSNNIYFFSQPGHEFDHIYYKISQGLKQQ